MSYLDLYNHSNKGQRNKIQVEVRKETWENTNFMLGNSGYSGCKTGITDAAGPCLSCTYNKDGYYFVIILLSAKSMEARWLEVPKLVEYAKARTARFLPNIILSPISSRVPSSLPPLSNT